MDTKKHEDIKDLDKSLFEKVERESKIHDKKFETKPIGYFKDAMIRFSKNRTNVIATSILFIMILLAIFVPILTTKNYTQLDTQLGFLPPRVPLLEDIGVFDGTRWVEAQTVDRDTIDPETGLGIPANFNEEFIIMESLENYEDTCTLDEEACIGGQVDFRLSDSGTGTFRSTERLTFTNTENTQITIDIQSFLGDDVEVRIYVTEDNEDTFTLLDTIDSDGEHVIDVFSSGVSESTFNSRIYFEVESDSSSDGVTLNSVEVKDLTSDEILTFDEGYELSQYSAVENGSVGRRNGKITKANFRFDSYGAAFSIQEDAAFPRSEFEEIMAEYPDACDVPDDFGPDDMPYEFDEGCPIMTVYSQSSPVAGPDGELHYSYSVVIDYMLYAGYEEIPYFFFGTTSGGRDLFAQTWLGLRTSLSIGLVVSIINITIGIIYGSIAGYYGGKVDIIMQRFSELVGRIPWLVTLSIFMAIIGPGALSLILILIVSGWIGVASVTRTQFYRYKGREYVLASRTLGAKDSRLIFRHILPNGIGTIITASILSIPLVIFTEAALSYLGFGIGHGQEFKLFGILELSGVSIGVLLSDGRTQMLSRPYLTVFPAVIISILMITFNMFGNALRDAFNPSLRGSN